MDDWFAAQLALSGKNWHGKRKEFWWRAGLLTKVGVSLGTQEMKMIFFLLCGWTETYQIYFIHINVCVCNRIALGERT